ncbi:MAG TPA: hypothetical protein VN642_06585 [Dongiaceae bacterium]|nr:hypothetical protein [Dongiaceae bacterium]
MAKTVAVKIPEDIEYRVIGNAFGLLIASAGLLAGEMVRLQSFDYWLNDIVPLLLLTWMLFRLYRNFLSTLIVYQGVTPSDTHSGDRRIHESLKSEQAAVAQIASRTGYTPEQVVEEVARRIETQKANAIKKFN